MAKPLAELIEDSARPQTQDETVEEANQFDANELLDEVAKPAGE